MQARFDAEASAAAGDWVQRVLVPRMTELVQISLAAAEVRYSSIERYNGKANNNPHGTLYAWTYMVCMILCLGLHRSFVARRIQVVCRLALRLLYQHLAAAVHA